MDYLDLKIKGIISATVYDYDRVAVFKHVLKDYQDSYLTKNNLNIILRAYRVYIKRPYKKHIFYDNFKQLILQTLNEEWHEFILHNTRFYYTNDYMQKIGMIDAVKTDYNTFITLGEPKNTINNIYIR